MSSLKHIKNVEALKEHIMADNSIVMIHKDNCSFCARAKPWLEQLSKDVERTNIALANKDDIDSVLEVFQVKMYPTFVSFKKGFVKDVFYGDTVEEKVTDFVKRNTE